MLVGYRVWWVLGLIHNGYEMAQLKLSPSQMVFKIMAAPGANNDRGIE